MKNLIGLTFMVALGILPYRSTAQDVVRQTACNDPAILRQADSIKSLLTGSGFTVIKEAAVSMESEYELPVVVPLTQGSWYQFIFIGDPSSRLYEVRMYDWSEKQVVYEKNLRKDAADANVIRYDYIPKFTEYHMIKPVQVNKKKKKLCGYVILLKKTTQQQSQ